MSIENTELNEYLPSYDRVNNFILRYDLLIKKKLVALYDSGNTRNIHLYNIIQALENIEKLADSPASYTLNKTKLRRLCMFVVETSK